MITLRRIGVQSAGRVGFWLGIATAAANIIVALVMLFIQLGIPPTSLPPEIWQQIGLGILISGIVTALAMGLFAFLYNMNGAFGGLELEFDMPDAPDDKRKNGESEEDDG